MKRKTFRFLSMFLLSICVFFGIAKIQILNADDQYTVTFHSGTGGDFEGGTDTNTVSLEPAKEDDVRNAQSQNIEFDGSGSGGYSSYRTETSEKMVFPGAASVEVTLTYGLYYESDYYNWVCVYDGSVTPNNNNYASSVTGKLSSKTKTTQTITVPGNTAQVYFRGYYNNGTGWGYHAYFRGYDSQGNIIQKDVINQVSGEYKNPVPNQENYIFGSWNTEPDGSGTQYSASTYKTITENTDLYAQYLPPYILSFDVNGGDSETPPDMIVINGRYSDPLPGATKSGAAFVGWYSEPTSGYQIGRKDQRVSVSKNQTLYARFAEGDFGCPWVITEDGTLEIGTEGQTCTLANTDNMTDNSWPWYYAKHLVKKVDIKGTVKASGASLTGMFAEQTDCESSDLSGLDTSNIRLFNRMFYNNAYLTDLTLGDGFDTANGIVFNTMFRGCLKLPDIDFISQFDLSSASDLGNMFEACNALKTVDLGSNFDITNVDNVTCLFKNCISLEKIDLGEHFNMAKQPAGSVFNTIFQGCNQLKEIDLGEDFDTSSWQTLSGMFAGLYSLEKVNFRDKFDTSNAKSLSGMFSGCNNVKELDFGDKFTGINTTSGGLGAMLPQYVEKVRFGNSFNIPSKTAFAEMTGLCKPNIKEMELGPSFDTSAWTDFSSMFSNFTALEKLRLENGFDTSNGTNFDQMFTYCTKLKELDLGDNFDTSKGTDFDAMFNSCKNLEKLDIGKKFKLSDNTSAQNMFMYTGSLAVNNLNDMRFGSNNDLAQMFYGSNILRLIVPDWNMDRPKLNFAFESCTDLKEVRFGTVNIDNSNHIEPMQAAFRSCSSLEYFSFAGGSLKTNLIGMFCYDSNLKVIDFSNIDASGITYLYSDVFRGCKSLKTVYVNETWPQMPDYSIGNRNVFGDCASLVGQQGTTLENNPMSDPGSDSGYKDTQYFARVDRALEGAPGYFTLKNRRHGDDIEYISEASKWEKLDDYTWRYVFDVFDDTLEYYLNEFNIGDYVSSIPETPNYIMVNENGEITKFAEITNRHPSGTLKIHKTATDSNTEATFGFRITLTGEGVRPGTWVIGDTIFNDGVANVKLKHDETLTIADIPSGVAYEVEETDPQGYIPTLTNETGTISSEESIVECLNTAPAERPSPGDGFANVALRKETVNDIGISADTEYTILASFTGLSPRTWYSVSNGEKFQSDQNGTAQTEIKIKKGETVTILSLPVGAKYQFAEEAGGYISSYKVTDAGGINNIASSQQSNTEKNKQLSTAQETVDLGEEITVTFKNIYKDTQSLKLTKAVESNSNDETKYEFTIRFTGIPEGADFDSTIGHMVPDDNGEIETTFLLSAGETAEFENIPVGSKYTIVESPSLAFARYEITTESGDTSHISKLSAENKKIKQSLSTAEETVDKDENAIITFTNNYDYSELTIKKTVVGNMGDKFREFNFTVTLKNSDNTPMTGEFEYVGTKAGTLVLDDNGQAIVSLSHNDEIRITAVPLGTKYTVTEQNYSKDGYKTTSSGTSGIIKQDSTLNNAAFINTNNAVIPTAADTNFKIMILTSVIGLFSMLCLFFSRKRKER